MAYRVMFYDLAGKLVCWYLPPNKLEADRYASRESELIKTKVERVYA